MAVATPTDELAVFADFCSTLTLESGAQMQLEAFQAQMLADYFGSANELVILLPKGNAKSTLLGMLALFAVLTEPDGEVLIVAAARDQAAIMLRQAQGLVRRHPDLRSRLTVKQREIVNPQLGSRIRVLASEVDTVDGVIPSHVLLDELHRHRRAELYGILRASLGKRDGRMVTISTAGDNEESPLGQLRTRAYSLPIQKRDGAYRYAASADGSFAMHEYALDAGQDLDDLALVKTANPLSSITIEQLRERHDSPSTTSWAWARFTCGAWVRGEYSAIQPQEWDALRVSGSSIPAGSEVYLGVDLAWSGPDCTAIVPVCYSETRSIVGDPVILQAPENGLVNDLAIVNAISTFASQYNARALVYDPNAGGAALAQQLERNLGLVCVAHSQRDSTMAEADGRLLLAIRRKQIVHSGDRTLRAHILNATNKSVAGDLFRFARPRHGPRVPIDALTALSMAFSVAVAEASAPKPDNSWFMF